MIKLCRTLVLSTLLMACGAAAPAQHVRFADLAKGGAGGLDWRTPIVLEFEAGDRLPIHVAFSDQLFELSPASPPLELVAKRHGFVRIEGTGITTSLSGDDFETKPLAPGTFRLGLAVTRQGTFVDLAATTPRKREPIK
jgi:hypothetical protein